MIRGFGGVLFTFVSRLKVDFNRVKTGFKLLKWVKINLKRVKCTEMLVKPCEICSSSTALTQTVSMPATFGGVVPCGIKKMMQTKLIAGWRCPPHRIFPARLAPAPLGVYLIPLASNPSPLSSDCRRGALDLRGRCAATAHSSSVGGGGALWCHHHNRRPGCRASTFHACRCSCRRVRLYASPSPSQ